MSPAEAIWLEAVGLKAEQLRAPAAGRLRERGFESRLLHGEAPAGPGIVFFDAAAPMLLDTLGDLRRSGADCVLAVATDGLALQSLNAWELLAAGASDVFAYEDSTRWVERVGARVDRWRHIQELAGSSAVRDRLVGKSPRWRVALASAIEVACFTDTPVILTGETGTGKELIARLIHALDARRHNGDLVLVDCTTIVPTLSGSEFFGHERGAFTGATAARDGAFALANEGTLFLDEVGELPLGLQSELLRVVQEGVYKRVGSNRWLKTSFRLVCATNRDLFAEAAAGRFRYDLLYRLAGSTLHLPSLGERRDDILPLARHFLRELHGPHAPDFEDDVSAFLSSREYRGNVRELRQLMTRISYRHVGPGPITVGDVPEDERASDLLESDWREDGLQQSIRQALARGITLREIGVAAGDVAVSVALREEDGNVQRAARRLGVTPRALQLRRAAGRQGRPISELD